MTRCVATGRELGRSWRSRRRAAGVRNRAGVEKGRRVEAVQAGGGAAAAAQRQRGGALHRRQRRQGGQRGARGRRKKGGPRDLYAKPKESRDLSVK
jgi:hypothetical protein